jgi:(p)ppGpp synthase/HD superfamily hydrolase
MAAVSLVKDHCCDADMLVATMLYDVVKAEYIFPVDIEKLFNSTVATLVEEITSAEKDLLTISDDALIIRLCEMLNNMKYRDDKDMVSEKIRILQKERALNRQHQDILHLIDMQLFTF